MNPYAARGLLMFTLCAMALAAGLSGVFRGQGIGIFKAIISLTLFHEGRLFLSRNFKEYNKRNGYMPK